jgi:hypothetical protein
MSDVEVSLSSDEALVLFELLHRWEDADAIDPALLPGEQTALWHLSASLERILTQPFDRDYTRLVSDARDRLFRQGGA